MTSTSFGDGISNTGIQLGVNNAPIYLSSGREEDPNVTLDNNVLSSLAFPQMLQRRDNIEPCYANTCEWILDLDEYQSWKRQHHSLLWIKGKPGAGKSTLMAFLHGRLEKSEFGGEDQGIRLDFFFSARGVELQRTALGMFRSLLNQIFFQDIDIRPRVREAYDQRCKRYGSERHKWEWPLVALEDLLTNAVLECASQQPVIVFVDALDETGAESAQQLATYFHRLLCRATDKDLPVQICISCRHYPILATANALEIYVENHNREDISTYIKDMMIETTGGAQNQETRNTLVDHLAKQANGVFQWVHLILPLIKRKIVQGESIEEIYAWLRGVPVGLKDVYTYVLNNVIDIGNREQSLLLFQWVCFAERPLTLTELRYALATSDAKMTPFPRRWEKAKGFIESDDRMGLRVMALSGGLVEVVSNIDDQETVQVVHQSVNDFLCSGGLEILFNFVDTDKLHSNSESLILQTQATLYRSCLVYFAMASIPQGFPHDRNVSIRTLILEQPLLVYSSQNIFIHAEKATEARVGVLHNEQELLRHVAVRWEVTHKFFYRNPSGNPSVGLLNRSTGLKLIHMAAAANMVDVLERIELDGGSLTEKDIRGTTALHSAAQSGHKQAAAFLYKKGLNRDAKTVRGFTPLIEAAACGQVGFIEWILYEGPPLEIPPSELQTAMYEASLNNHPTVVEVLLHAGTDPNTRGGLHGSPLQAAAINGNREVVRMLLAVGAMPNMKGGYYGNALQAAVYGGNIEVFQMILDAGADLDMQNGYYGSTLQAAAHSRNTEIFRMLIAAGANPHIQGGLFGNVLQAAVHVGTAEMLQIILDTGVDPNTQGGKDENGQDDSTLHAAAVRGNVDKVQMLLFAGAQPNAQGGYYGNALQAAANAENPEMVQMLLAAGAEPNAQGGYYGNALQAAANADNPEMVQMLLAAGAEPNAHGGRHGTALCAAASAHSIEVARILLDVGANPNVRGNLIGNALQTATYSQNFGIVQMLIGAHAYVDAPGGYLGPALMVAVHKRNFDLVRILLDAGANPLGSDDLGRTPLHIVALQNDLQMIHAAPEILSAADTGDKLLQTPLHIVLGFEHIRFARILLDIGADALIEDGYGRNAMDWASGHEDLILELRDRCPDIAVTPEDTQKVVVRQSILKITETLLNDTITNPWPLVRQLGRLFLFLDKEEETRFLFQLGIRKISGIRPRYEVRCALCGWDIHGREYVCRECATIELCPHCAEGNHSLLYGSTPHRKEHEVFEVVSGPHCDDLLHETQMETLKLFLNSVIPKYTASTDQHVEPEPSDDSMSDQTLERMTRNFLAATIGPISIVCAAILAALAFLLRCFYF